MTARGQSGFVATVLVLLTTLAISVDAAEEETEKSAPIKLALELSDGSRIVGVPEAGTLPFATAYGKMDIALKLVDSLEFSDDRETVTVLFRNGDKLEGALSVKEIKLATLFGEQSIPLKHVVSMEILTGGSLNALFRRGLVLYYSFDRDEKGKVTDKSGKGNHGKVHGAKWTAKGKVGGAYEFDGIDDYVDAGNNPSLRVSEGTISAWIRTLSASVQFAGGIPYDDRTRWNAPWVGLQVGSSGNQGRFWLNINGSDHEFTAGAISLNQWHHIVLTYDGNRKIGYVDGNKVYSAYDPGTIRYSGSPSFVVGVRSKQAQGEWFDGNVDEVMIFNRALSPQEIKRLYNSQK